MSRTDDPLHCIICGAAMIAMPARAACPNCGYEEGGDDIFPAQATTPAVPVKPPPPDFDDTLFPIGPRVPRVARPRLPRRRPLLPPTDWLFDN